MIQPGGLKPLSIDERDFSHSKVLGALSKLPAFPPTFILGSPLDVKDQRDSDCCTCYACAEAIQHNENVILDPLYLFALAKDASGDVDGFGLDLRVPCKIAQKIGIIEQSVSPFTLDKGRDFIAHLSNWPNELKWSAGEHRQKAFVKIDGPFDLFDNIRVALYRQNASPVVTGALWRGSWTYAKDAIVKEVGEDDGGGHAFMLRGWVEIDNVTYLYAQLSNGEEIGDKGFYYFTREVVNSQFTFGSFQFIDMPKETAQAIHESPWPSITRFLFSIKNLFTRRA